MKLFNNKQLLLRMVAAVAESILFYIGFLLVNQIVDGSRINIAFFIVTALCGLFVNFLPYNSFDKRKHAIVFGSIGLALAVISVGISSIKGFNLLAMPIGFIALIFLYYRSYTSYLANVYYVYTAGNFYQSIIILFVVNAVVAVWSRNGGVISEELMRYSVLYIVIALYMLSEVKNFRYVSKNENSRKTTFDMIATGFMIIATVIMSMPGVFKTLVSPFAASFQFIYGWIVKGILFITYPVAVFINYILSLLPEIEQEGRPKADFDNLLGMPDKYEESLQNLNSPLVQLIGKALAFIFMLIICAYAIYLLFRFIDRFTRAEEEEDFVEDKEFVLRSKKKKDSGRISKLANSIKKAADNISFRFTADNTEKLRHEYKAFIQRLYSKKIIENNNDTAQDILERMLSIIPNQKDALISITDTYEDVRYGVRLPKDNELKSFRKNIAEVSKSLQLMP
ncbi:MAG: hypothetical protein K0S75_1409 [Clostridia bacterium]|nr:hypothetical protein [Clostridia bacterium]